MVVRHGVCNVEPRYTELLNLVNEEILQLQEKLRQQGVKHHLAAGIVLTGGAAQIEGLAACAQRVFHTQVRIGAPLNITGLTDYAQEPLFDGGGIASLWERVTS